MMSTEVKEVIYVSIALILVGFVLTLVALGLDFRSDVAEIQNEQAISKYMLVSTNEFEKYQDAVIYGEDLVYLIKEYSDDMLFYIDGIKIKDAGNLGVIKIYQQNDESVCTVEGTFKGEKIPNTLFYLNKQDASYDKEGNMVSEYRIDSNCTYYCFLVYDNYDINTYDKAKIVNTTTDYTRVTGFYIHKVGEGRHIYTTQTDTMAAKKECGCWKFYKAQNNCDAQTALNNCVCKAIDYSNDIDDFRNSHK